VSTAARNFVYRAERPTAHASPPLPGRGKSPGVARRPLCAAPLRSRPPTRRGQHLRGCVMRAGALTPRRAGAWDTPSRARIVLGRRAGESVLPWFGRHGTMGVFGRKRTSLRVGGWLSGHPHGSWPHPFAMGLGRQDDGLGMVRSSYVRMGWFPHRPERFPSESHVHPQPPDVRITFFWSLRLNGTSFTSLCGVPLTARDMLPEGRSQIPP
jgi:hypothetical protein